MKVAGLILAFLSLVPTLPQRAFADVVPPRRAGTETEAVQVRNRLLALGVGTGTAEARVSSLTARELEFFAGDRGGVQVVSGIQFVEALGGIFILGLVTFFYFGYVSRWPRES
ncbi:MAG: hypothetical protein HY716_03215 [Planctomycetes bacterium]|nr:hypothetical protein [Planctomycetota bacterium]